jgi:hypothetical protein
MPGNAREVNKGLALHSTALGRRYTMKYQFAYLVLAFGLTGGCADTDLSHATSPVGTNAFSGSISLSRESSARSGSLVVEKNCQFYTGNAGDSCTITTSSLEAIPVGSVITYKSAAVAGMLSTDVTLDPPGPGNNTASGHCVVNLTTGLGTCSFAGGTGRFRGFHATVDVTPLGWPNFEWNGTYYYDN